MKFFLEVSSWTVCEIKDFGMTKAEINNREIRFSGVKMDCCVGWKSVWWWGKEEYKFWTSLDSSSVKLRYSPIIIQPSEPKWANRQPTQNRIEKKRELKRFQQLKFHNFKKRYILFQTLFFVTEPRQRQLKYTGLKSRVFTKIFILPSQPSSNDF